MTHVLRKFGEVVKNVTKSSVKYIQKAYTNITQNVIQLEAQEATVVRELRLPKGGMTRKMFRIRREMIKSRNILQTLLQLTIPVTFPPKKLEKCTLPHKTMIEVKPMRKFKIPNIPATEPKSIRFPVDVISEVEDTIRGRDCTFSAFVVEAVRVALESLQEEDEEKEKQDEDTRER